MPSLLQQKRDNMDNVEKPARWRRSRHQPAAFPACRCSEKLIVIIDPDKVNLFRFLLEGYDNLAFFTVLNRKTALLKVAFSPHQRVQVEAALNAIGMVISLRVQEWPIARQETQ